MTKLELLKTIRRFDGNMSREQNQRYAELVEMLEKEETECKMRNEERKDEDRIH